MPFPPTHSIDRGLFKWYESPADAPPKRPSSSRLARPLHCTHRAAGQTPSGSCRLRPRRPNHRRGRLLSTGGGYACLAHTTPVWQSRRPVRLFQASLARQQCPIRWLRLVPCPVPLRSLSWSKARSQGTNPRGRMVERRPNQNTAPETSRHRLASKCAHMSLRRLRGHDPELHPALWYQLRPIGEPR